MKVMRRVRKLFEAACEARPEIPKDFGESRLILDVEAVLVREMYAEGMVEELIELEIGMKPEHVDLILEGQVWPYAGGALRRVMTGPHPKNCYSNNQRRFVRGVNSIAVDYLTKEELEVYCNMTGITVLAIQMGYKRMEVKDGKSKFKRLRGLLLHAAEGKEIDKASSTVGTDGAERG